MRNFSRRKWLGLSLLAVACLAALAAFSLRKPAMHEAQANAPEPADSEPSPTSAVVRVEVVHPSYGGVERQTIQPGSVIAFESADLYAKISGYLKQQTVDIGSRVKQGDLLAEIDAPELNKQVDQDKAAVDQANAQVKQSEARIVTAQAELTAAQAFVKQAESEIERTQSFREYRQKSYQRMKDLFERQSIERRLVDEKEDELGAAFAAEHSAQAGVMTAKAKVSAAEATVQQAKADLVNARANVEAAKATLAKAAVFVDYTKILSPYDGVVTKRIFFRGAFIRSAEQGGLVPLLGVGRTDLMRVVVQVPDLDVPYLNIGNPAEISIDALPGERFKGPVSRMADAEDPETRTMRVEIDLPNTAGKLRDGMYGRVAIQLTQGSKLLAIPSDCLVGAIDNGKASVYVVENGVARLQKIDAGADTGLRIEVVQGLTEKNQVVSKHSAALKDGAAVEVTGVDQQ